MTTVPARADIGAVNVRQLAQRKAYRVRVATGDKDGDFLHHSPLPETKPAQASDKGGVNDEGFGQAALARAMICGLRCELVSR